MDMLCVLVHISPHDVMSCTFYVVVLVRELKCIVRLISLVFSAYCVQCMNGCIYVVLVVETEGGGARGEVGRSTSAFFTIYYNTVKVTSQL